MHRLAILEHDIVGDIDNVIDRPNTSSIQALTQPSRRGLNLDVLDNLCRIARAQLRLLHLNRDIVLDIVAAALNNRLMNGKRTVESRCGLTCQTNHGQAVWAVRSNFKLNDIFVQTQYILDVCAYRSAFGQKQNAIVTCVRYAAVVDAEFLERAHHTVRLNATQLALGDLDAAGQGGLMQRNRADAANGLRGDVRCTGNDLHRLFLAYVQLANYQMVGIRMLFNRQNLTGHNIINFSAQIFNALNLRTGHRQRCGIFLERNAINIRIIFQP